MKKILENTAITLIAIALTLVMAYELASLDFFAPRGGADRFEITDFYQSAANRRNVKKLCADVVLIPIDGIDRQGICNILEELYYCEPAAVGLDISFAFAQQGDDRLVSAIEALPICVVPDTGAYIYSAIPSLRQGSTVLESSSKTSPVRYCLTSGTLASELASVIRKDTPAKEKEIIEYGEWEFDIVQPGEVLESSEYISGKLILLGALEEEYDFHPTPLYDSTPGVMIHAYSTATLLSPAWISQFPSWLDWIVSIIVGFAFVWLIRELKKHDWGDFVMRVIQAMLLIMIVYVGYCCYIHFRLNVDFALPLLMVATASVAVDLWNGGEGLLNLWKRKRTHIRQIFKKIKTRFSWQRLFSHSWHF